MDLDGGVAALVLLIQNIFVVPPFFLSHSNTAPAGRVFQRQDDAGRDCIGSPTGYSFQICQNDVSFAASSFFVKQKSPLPCAKGNGRGALTVRLFCGTHSADCGQILLSRIPHSFEAGTDNGMCHS